MADYILRAETGVIIITPFALAKFAHHMFSMAATYEGESSGSLLPRLYLFCVSIELGMKAIILSKSCDGESKALIKKMGHDLIAIQDYLQSKCNIRFFEANESESLIKINQFYRDKALEYFTLPMLEAVMNGYKDLPSVEEMESAAKKIEQHLADNDYFLSGTTSTT